MSLFQYPPHHERKMILKLGGFCKDVGVEVGLRLFIQGLHSSIVVCLLMYTKFPLDWSLCE